MKPSTETSSPFFRPNLERKGRIVRGLGALALALAGAIMLFKIALLGIVLLVSAGFVLVEAVRGWCVLRACGVKTKI
jgi:hypothetical protein